MVNHGSPQHQQLVRDTVEELKNLDYNVVNTNGFAPDAIATKDGKLFAVEILLINYIPKQGWEHLGVVKRKRDKYRDFDDVIFKIENRNIKGIDKQIKILTGIDKEQKKWEKNAKKIVEEFILDLQKKNELSQKVIK